MSSVKVDPAGPDARPAVFEQLDPCIVKGRDTPVVAFRITGEGNGHG